MCTPKYLYRIGIITFLVALPLFLFGHPLQQAPPPTETHLLRAKTVTLRSSPPLAQSAIVDDDFDSLNSSDVGHSDFSDEYYSMFTLADSHTLRHAASTECRVNRTLLNVVEGNGRECLRACDNDLCCDVVSWTKSAHNECTLFYECASDLIISAAVLYEPEARRSITPSGESAVWLRSPFFDGAKTYPNLFELRAPDHEKELTVVSQPRNVVKGEIELFLLLSGGNTLYLPRRVLEQVAASSSKQLVLVTELFSFVDVDIGNNAATEPVRTTHHTERTPMKVDLKSGRVVAEPFFLFPRLLEFGDAESAVRFIQTIKVVHRIEFKMSKKKMVVRRQSSPVPLYVADHFITGGDSSTSFARETLTRADDLVARHIQEGKTRHLKSNNGLCRGGQNELLLPDFDVELRLSPLSATARPFLTPTFLNQLHRRWATLVHEGIVGNAKSFVNVSSELLLHSGTSVGPPTSTRPIAKIRFTNVVISLSLAMALSATTPKLNLELILSGGDMHTTRTGKKALPSVTLPLTLFDVSPISNVPLCSNPHDNDDASGQPLIGVSLVVHNCFECVLHQVGNIAKYAPRTRVMIYDSSFETVADDKSMARLRAAHPSVALATSNFSTPSWGKRKHYNYLYLFKHLNNAFELCRRSRVSHVVFFASNERLVKPGLERYIQQFDGVSMSPPTSMSGHSLLFSEWCDHEGKFNGAGQSLQSSRRPLLWPFSWEWSIGLLMDRSLVHAHHRLKTSFGHDNNNNNIFPFHKIYFEGSFFSRHIIRALETALGGGFAKHNDKNCAICGHEFGYPSSEAWPAILLSNTLESVCRHHKSEENTSQARCKFGQRVSAMMWCRRQRKSKRFYATMSDLENVRKPSRARDVPFSLKRIKQDLSDELYSAL